MARLKALPSLETIKGFRGVIDFAVWKGVPIARAWPRYRYAQLTPATKAAAALFGLIIKSYSLLAAEALAFFQEDAKDQPRTPRDIFVSAVYGHLHEASMSDFLTLLTECRDSLQALRALLNALDSVSADEIDVNIERSVLPIDASTLAEQQTQTTALEIIDDLADALESVATNRLIVRGEDQLFSIKQVLGITVIDTISGADGIVTTPTVLPNEYWVVTHVTAYDNTTAPTIQYIQSVHDAAVQDLLQDIKVFVLRERSSWSGMTFLDEGDFIQAGFVGGLVGDTCILMVIGYKITLET